MGAQQKNRIHSSSRGSSCCVCVLLQLSSTHKLLAAVMGKITTGMESRHCAGHPAAPRRLKAQALPHDSSPPKRSCNWSSL
eukprot:1139815-Amphidinium_carterae.1